MKAPRALRTEILVTGNEILAGRIVDTNSAMIAGRLLALGIGVTRITACGDDLTEILQALNLATAAADLVVVTGGLGPTEDDRTTEAAAKAFGRELAVDEPTLAWLTDRFKAYGLEMTPNNRKQAVFPSGAKIIPNEMGTARGFWLEKEKRIALFLPGVPRELEAMLDSWVVPFLARRLGVGAVMRTLVLKTFGLTESALDQELANPPMDPARARIGFLARFPENHVSVSITASSEEEADRLAAQAEKFVESKVGRYVFTRDANKEMEQVVGGLLLEAGLTLAVAESCTGGMIAARITNVPGSSAYFDRSAVTYSNRAKDQLLGVSADTLARHGAVSETCARQMAEGVREGAGADLGLSVTGIAGPDGGTDEKPVGTVFIAIADEQETHVRRFRFRGDRLWIRTLTTYAALDLLRRRLLGDQSWRGSDYLSRWSYRRK